MPVMVLRLLSWLRGQWWIEISESQVGKARFQLLQPVPDAQRGYIRPVIDDPEIVLRIHVEVA